MSACRTRGMRLPGAHHRGQNGGAEADAQMESPRLVVVASNCRTFVSLGNTQTLGEYKSSADLATKRLPLQEVGVIGPEILVCNSSSG